MVGNFFELFKGVNDETGGFSDLVGLLSILFFVALLLLDLTVAVMRLRLVEVFVSDKHLIVLHLKIYKRY